METYAQHSIRHCMNMIAPFEMPDQQEENGHLQFYRFMVSLYQEMYERPEEYMVFPKPYEEYIAKLKGQEVREKKEKQHSANSRESTLRNTFQQAIQFYALYIYKIGLRSEGIDAKSGALIVRKADFDEVTEQSLQRFCMRRIMIYSNGLKTSFPRDYVNAQITAGFILEASQGVCCGLSNRAEIVKPDDHDMDKALYVLRKYRNNFKATALRLKLSVPGCLPGIPFLPTAMPALHPSFQ